MGTNLITPTPPESEDRVLRSPPNSRWGTLEVRDENGAEWGERDREQSNQFRGTNCWIEIRWKSHSKPTVFWCGESPLKCLMNTVRNGEKEGVSEIENGPSSFVVLTVGLKLSGSLNRSRSPLSLCARKPTRGFLVLEVHCVSVQGNTFEVLDEDRAERGEGRCERD